MDIAISGASGLIGSALTTSLSASGHRPIALVRRDPRPAADEVRWDPAAGTIDAASLEGIDAVVHLAGAGIGDKRWTDERKRVIRDSRVDGTKLLAATVAELDRQPSVFVSGSAIGYYPNGEADLTEESAPGSGFLTDVVVAWEAAAAPVVEAGVRTAFARTGLVLSGSGGVLAKQLPLFKLGLGGRIGSGEQWMSWITLEDEVRALEYLLTNPVTGPVNLTAPNPVTNNTFTDTLGDVLNRPTVLPVPMFGPKLLFGTELVEALLLSNQRVLPTVLESSDFEFEHAELEPALRSVLQKPAKA